MPVSWSTQIRKNKNKMPTDHENNRIRKYAKYLKENEILPIPDLVEAVEPKTLSFVVIDQKTRKLAGLKKEVFEETLKIASIPAKYICRRGFASWDVLLPSGDLAKKLATNNITTKFLWLQLEYKGKRRIKVIVCNVSMQLNRDVLTGFLSSFGSVEDHTFITSVNGTAYGNYVFTVILDIPRHPIYHNIPRHHDDSSRWRQKTALLGR